MLTTEQLTGIVRAVLAAAGGATVFSSDQLTAVAGAAVILVTAIWSVLSKKKPAPAA